MSNNCNASAISSPKQVILCSQSAANHVYTALLALHPASRSSAQTDIDTYSKEQVFDNMSTVLLRRSRKLLCPQVKSVAAGGGNTHQEC